jgi:hypothetical protein
VAKVTHKSSIVFSPQADFTAIGMELGDNLSWSVANLRSFRPDAYKGVSDQVIVHALVPATRLSERAQTMQGG